MISRKWILSATMLAFTALPAFADTQTEEYVRTNANDVLASLNTPGLSAAERRVQFQTYMDEFTNLDAVARFVIGKYAKRFSDEEMEAYLETFRNYALVVYEFYFNEYRGRDVKVVGSTDRNARDSIVDTEIVRADGQELEVRWRVLNRGGKYQVVDVALNAEGNLIWLAIEQQAQFLSILDQNNGSSEALIAKINSMTADLVAQRPADES
ncbi:MAG: MlaC/ttg2D family ABC transporter substrate-binding protein [Henriciella sp.]